MVTPSPPAAGPYAARWASRSSPTRMRCTKIPGVWMQSGSSSPAGHQLLDLGDGDSPGGGHHRVEVLRRLAKDEVAVRVAAPRLHQREVGGQGVLEHAGDAVDLAGLFAVGHRGAVPGRREEGPDAGAACADALGQRALGRQLDLELTGEELLLEVLVLADVARDHLADLAILQQHAQALVVGAAVVRDDRQVLGAQLRQRGDEVLGVAAEPKSPAHHDGAVADAV
jgi:hypothetical protein